ncbi:hypothetical protein SAMN04487762_1237 [Polaribacter sp. Hel1_33_78]|nr:hypothetical protein SAMN04487762_1237 [Polaribacter sp. Hel1_33_78]
MHDFLEYSFQFHKVINTRFSFALFLIFIGLEIIYQIIINSNR